MKERSATLAGHQGPVTAVGLSADGKTVTTRGMETVRFWNCATGSALGSIRLPADALRDIYSVAFVANDRAIVLGLGRTELSACMTR
jgi:WD40 repeat protein